MKTRPCKIGLDYFRFDMGLLTDKKFRTARSKYGYLAPMVYIALLTLAYEDKGYYIPYGIEGERSRADCVCAIQQLLQGKYCPDEKLVAYVIDELVACGLFSGDHYPKNITARRIQQFYFRVTARRYIIDIDESIWMLSEREMREIAPAHLYFAEEDNANNISDNVNNNGRTANNNSQRKEKDRTEKDRTGQQRERGFLPPTLAELIDYCNEKSLNVDTLEFLRYYDETGWRDRDGKAVKNWKGKMLTWDSHSRKSSAASPKTKDYRNRDEDFKRQLEKYEDEKE